jgi:hypothetical protein
MGYDFSDDSSGPSDYFGGGGGGGRDYFGGGGGVDTSGTDTSSFDTSSTDTSSTDTSSFGGGGTISIDPFGGGGGGGGGGGADQIGGVGGGGAGDLGGGAGTADQVGGVGGREFFQGGGYAGVYGGGAGTASEIANVASGAGLGGAGGSIAGLADATARGAPAIGAAESAAAGGGISPGFAPGTAFDIAAGDILSQQDQESLSAPDQPTTRAVTLLDAAPQTDFGDITPPTPISDPFAPGPVGAISNVHTMEQAPRTAEQEAQMIKQGRDVVNPSSDLWRYDPGLSGLQGNVYFPGPGASGPGLTTPTQTPAPEAGTTQTEQDQSRTPPSQGQPGDTFDPSEFIDPNTGLPNLLAGNAPSVQFGSLAPSTTATEPAFETAPSQRVASDFGTLSEAGLVPPSATASAGSMMTPGQVADAEAGMFNDFASRFGELGGAAQFGTAGQAAFATEPEFTGEQQTGLIAPEYYNARQPAAQFLPGSEWFDLDPQTQQWLAKASFDTSGAPFADTLPFPQRGAAIPELQAPNPRGEPMGPLTSWTDLIFNNPNATTAAPQTLEALPGAATANQIPTTASPGERPYQIGPPSADQADQYARLRESLFPSGGPTRIEAGAQGLQPFDPRNPISVNTGAPFAQFATGAEAPIAEPLTPRPVSPNEILGPPDTAPSAPSAPAQVETATAAAEPSFPEPTPRGGFERGPPPPPVFAPVFAPGGLGAALMNATAPGAIATPATTTALTQQQQQLSAIQNALTQQWRQTLLNEGIDPDDPTVQGQVQQLVAQRMQQLGLPMAA